ncbi:hypothetical protein [Sulfurivermis fontis]|uniref:hypothetical protein n=1 Tax=Sulfurivermis fontis TaxID=1972068 RepID=UPI000FDA15F9|nr:hypothetical protein [Sulfurivermis fontis]
MAVKRDALAIAREIFGRSFPDGATSFATEGRIATFVVGPGRLIDVPFNDDQADALRAHNMIGPWGTFF